MLGLSAVPSGYPIGGVSPALWGGPGGEGEAAWGAHGAWGTALSSQVAPGEAEIGNQGGDLYEESAQSIGMGVPIPGCILVMGGHGTKGCALMVGFGGSG